MTLAHTRTFTLAIDDDGKLCMWGLQKGFRVRDKPTLMQNAQLRGDTLYHNVNFVMVSAANFHSAAIAENGTVWTWGKDYYDCLGHNKNGNRYAPQQINREQFNGCKALMVTCGMSYTMVLTTCGKLYTFGKNGEGQLGLGNKTVYESVPQLVVYPDMNQNQITMIAASKYHSLALSERGVVYTWGYGGDGALGLNNLDEKLSPSMLNGELFDNSRIVFVAAGDDMSSAITDDGTLFVWGSGAHGQLGTGDRHTQLRPVAIENNAFDHDKIHTVTCSANVTLMVTTIGTVWSSGYGYQGSIWYKSNINRLVPTRVDAQHFGKAKIINTTIGQYVMTAVTTEGELYSWGKAYEPMQHDTYIHTGLGHPDCLCNPPPISGPCGCRMQDRLVPTRVNLSQITSARVGRYNSLAPERALAFAMGSLERLANPPNSFSYVNILDANLVRMIVDLCKVYFDRDSMEGVVRLLGACFK